MMTSEQRFEWLETRKKAIGGSEIGALLSHIIKTVKYGCRRNLWYLKSDYEPDVEQENTAPMQLGVLMEGPACDLYSDLTGNKVEEIPRMVHPELPQASVSIDRLVRFSDDEIPGVIEAKNVGNRTFYSIKRHGEIPTEYLIQINQGMLIASANLGIDIQRGVMVVGKSDDPAFIARTIKWHLGQPLEKEVSPPFILHWEVSRNDDICEAIMREIPIFWKSLRDEKQIPDRIEDENDPRCGRCQFKLRCRGVAFIPSSEDPDIPIDPDLSALAQEYIERKKLADDADELVEETKEIFMTLLGERQAVQVPINGVNRPIYWRPQEGTPLYKDAVTGMSAQYNIMRDRLIQIEAAAQAEDDNLIVKLATGSELIPPPSSYIKKGKGKRPLMLQYLADKTRDE